MVCINLGDARTTWLVALEGSKDRQRLHSKVLELVRNKVLELVRS